MSSPASESPSTSGTSETLSSSIPIQPSIQSPHRSYELSLNASIMEKKQMLCGRGMWNIYVCVYSVCVLLVNLCNWTFVRRHREKAIAQESMGKRLKNRGKIIKRASGKPRRTLGQGPSITIAWIFSYWSLIVHLTCIDFANKRCDEESVQQKGCSYEESGLKWKLTYR